MPNGKAMAALVIAAVLTAGAQTVGKGIGHGVNVLAVKTKNVVVHIVKHPVDSAKNGAIKHAGGN